MKYDRIDQQLYIKSRAKFSAMLEPNSLAVFNSNDIFPISADSSMPFQQHRDILYLSGVDQAESILVIYPTCSNEKHREVLFLKETNEHIAIWEGAKLTKEDAFAVSGIQTVYWLTQFPVIFKQMMKMKRELESGKDQYSVDVKFGQYMADKYIDPVINKK